MKPRHVSAIAALLTLFGAAAFAQAPATAPKTEGAQKKRGGQDNWPKKIKAGEVTISIDAPIAENLDGTKLKARGTARVQKGEDGAPSYATVSYDADVEIDHDRRVVTLTAVHVKRFEMPGAPAAQQERLSERLTQALTHMQPKLSLDDVLASTKMARGHGEIPKLNTDPPKIVFEAEPAILVVYDGEPRFKTVEGSKLERALNTPFLVLRVPGQNTYYLSGGTTWFRAADPKGPWAKAEAVPPEAVRIAQRDLKDGGVSESETKEAASSADKRVPKIIVATDATELIVSDGAPQWSPVVPGELETIGNSESNVFRTLPDHQVWIVLSGRWYRSGSLSGPWAWVEPDKLPGSFAKIPSDSPKADTLAFVPGTGPAHEALADASTPRTSSVKRSDAHTTVTYDGDPKFEAVPGTHVEYAVNTPDQILRIRNRYYVCDQGIWFVGGAPNGPFAVADSIPEDEIQTIPPESPVYNTRYAYVYDSTPELVYMAYTPAYLGSYPYYGGVVYGTGWAYRPWWGAFYYPRPWTWGFHARYAPFVGWGYGFSWGPGWGGFRYGFGYGWGARFCGPGAFFRPGFFHPGFYHAGYRAGYAAGRAAGSRNLYNSGANKARTSSTHTASNAAHGQKQAGNKQTGNKQAGNKTGSKSTAQSGHTGSTGKSGSSTAGKDAHKSTQKGSTAHGGGAKPKSGGAHAGGHAGGHGGKKG